MLTVERKPSKTPFTPEVQHTFEDGVTTVIPVDYLWGRQRPEEYSNRHTRRVREALRNNGADFLREYPVWAALVREATGARLIIVDGHHRSRFAPVYKIHEIPTRIITIELLARVTGQEPQELAAQYLNQANIADSRLADTRSYKFRTSRTLPTNGWVWTPLGIAEHFQNSSTANIHNGNHLTAESSDAGRVNDVVPEPRFPGTGEDWVYSPGRNNYVYVGTDPEIIGLKRAIHSGMNGVGK